MLKCINPATGEVIDQIRCDDRRKVNDKFRSLQQGQKKWHQTLRSKRAAVVERFRDLFLERREQFVKLLTAEVGRPVRQARVELEMAQLQIDYFLDISAETANEATETSGGADSVVEREPLGVMTHISTWNLPCLIGVRTMIPALLAGNSVLYKPSEHAALLGRALVETLWDAGIDEDVIDIAIGGGAVGDYILDSPLSAVAFTGSYSTGRMIAEKLATRMIPRHLELGGKDGVYVCDDVDLDAAVEQVAHGAFYNSGQCCRSIERVYVHDDIYRQFTEELCQRVATYIVGEPSQETTFIGPLINKRRLDALEYQIGDAVQKGAKLLLGGRTNGGKGNFFEPTVLVNADHRMLVMREETSGPVVAVQSVTGDEEALRNLSDTEYGLGAGVFSEDRQRACSLLEQLNVGRVYWNGPGEDGIGASAVGRRHSGLELSDSPNPLYRYTRAKTWHFLSGIGAA